MKDYLKASMVATLMLAPGLAMADSSKAVGQLDTSWGGLTKESATTDGQSQGEHSSDPSGDGRGPEDRAGLANVLDRGNMAATTSYIDSVVNP